VLLPRKVTLHTERTSAELFSFERSDSMPTHVTKLLDAKVRGSCAGPANYLTINSGLLRVMN
jgi:hypothetical protein